MLLHGEDTDEPETAEALSKFAPQPWTSLVSPCLYTVLKLAGGLLERSDKQIFQPRREVWPSNPSGLTKVLLFCLDHSLQFLNVSDNYLIVFDIEHV